MLLIEDGMVWGHEGRHRMDVFKEQGLDLVPVRISDADHRNGNFKLPYESLLSENGTVRPMPKPVFTPGVDVKPTTVGLKRTQAGVIDVKAIEESAKKIGRGISALTSAPIKFLKAKEQIVIDTIGDNSFIPKGDTPEKIIADALKQKDAPSDIWQNMQSGLTNYGEKVQSALASGVARWINYGEKVGNKYFNERVKPMEKLFSDLPKQDRLISPILFAVGWSLRFIAIA